MTATPAVIETPLDPDELPDGFEVSADEAAFERFIQEGEDDIAAARVVPHEEVVAELRAFFAGLRAR